MLKLWFHFCFTLALVQIPLAGAMSAEVTVGAIRYLSGGIGVDEEVELKSMASCYVLEMVSLIKSGPGDQYTADSRVCIRNKVGKAVLDGISEGPFLLANLPDGSYQVVVSEDGNSKPERVLIKKGTHRRLVFV
ncbi:hypothetical protein [Herminiimonas contaminans]|uniref:Carboxypeptidase family protein n=1 Tax=Herminiimonas contaminans TaxID=1111140 RepID=A0ABS0EU58_9BURK|nr:hypothetical protein [Herminiimonas contaminans]MBF8178361.1 hypothetical protein [Herminiimonas contaminans]